MSRLPGPVLRTGRLVLRAPRDDDAEAVWRAMGHPAVYRPLGGLPPRNRVAARENIRDHLRGVRAGGRVGYVCLHGESGDLVGWCCVKNVDVQGHMNGELAYWLARPYWGQGFMGEALETLVPHAFVGLGLHRLYAIVLATNRRSCGVLERLGFAHECTMRKGHLRAGDGLRRDAHMYGLLSTDPPARRMVRTAQGRM